jgi:hypothetical protein
MSHAQPRLHAAVWVPDQRKMLADVSPGGAQCRLGAIADQVEKRQSVCRARRGDHGGPPTEKREFAVREAA